MPTNTAKSVPDRVWDPWTKRARLARPVLRLWCWEWDDLAWCAGLNYFMGSILFVGGSSISLWAHLKEHPELARWSFHVPYMVGSVMFTVGSVLLVLLSIKTHPDRLEAPPPLSLGGTPLSRSRGPSRATSRAVSRVASPAPSTPSSEADVTEAGEMQKVIAALHAVEQQEKREAVRVTIPSTPPRLVGSPAAPPRFPSAVTPPRPTTPPPGMLSALLDSQQDSPEPELPTAPKRWIGSWFVSSGSATERLLPQTEDDMSRLHELHYTRDPYHYLRSDPWYHTGWKADITGACLILFGAVLYNVSCWFELYQNVFGREPFAGRLARPHWWLVFAPNVIGGVCFVTGSYAYGIAAQHSFVPFTSWRRGTRSISWWITTLNLLGSIGFYAGAQFTTPILALWPDLLIRNWVEIGGGYVIGSAMFMVGSYLMIVEIASDGA